MVQFMCEKLMSSTLSRACPLNRRNVTRLTLDLQSLSVVLGVGSEIFARSAAPLLPLSMHEPSLFRARAQIVL